MTNETFLWLVSKEDTPENVTIDVVRIHHNKHAVKQTGSVRSAKSNLVHMQFVCIASLVKVCV